MNDDNKAVINFDYCKGCGICAEECPVDAIEMSREVK
jgi:pyruvate ferredoxin oxidoreductase delta subunit